jgi:hypothetical protein
MIKIIRRFFMSNGNTGKENSGHYNSGNFNSGNFNSGNFNSGDFNSGHYNSGDFNSGDFNSGDFNSGHYNSGHYNSGNRNSGHYNSGHYNSGFFNTDEPNARLFNKDTGKKLSEINIPYFPIEVTEWVSEENMTDEQKKADPQFFVKRGTLITRSYKEAWQLAWSKAGENTKKLFLDLPNFDADIFLEITGIDVRKNNTYNGKIVEIDGKKYKLTEV